METNEGKDGHSCLSKNEKREEEREERENKIK
jgi:hypothetical protein